LYGRKGSRRFSIYVPEELTGELEKAIRNGRSLQKVVAEAGRRYTVARKNERSVRDKK
jgi:metal-responsive CopG/Arc/MetJ family transcriptional regulator